MMTRPNIYATVAFDLHPRARDFIEQLNREGQIDLDATGHPYLLNVQKVGPNLKLEIVRNNAAETILINTRKKAPPLTTWDTQDGYVRQKNNQTMIVQPQAGAPRPERSRRTLESYRKMVDEILR